MSMATGAGPSPPPGTGGGDGSRNRYADLLRVVAIGAVVVGHWLATSITYRGGRLGGQDVLGPLPWTRWLTLAFQVMPVFFLVGGFANAASWTSHRARGQDWGRWLHGRAVRLLVPTTVYVVVAVAVVAACGAAGAGRAVLGQAAWAVALHLWFLPVYLALIAATPALHAAHRRFGLLAAAVLAAAGVAANAAFLVFHPPGLAWIDYVLVWGSVHQLGFGWQDGTLTRDRRRPLALAAAGAAALAGLVWLGPYPMSMVGVPGARVKNSAPPSAALLAYAVAQTGLLLAAEPAVARALRRPLPWKAVSGAGRTVLTLYLWHMAPVVLAAVALYPTGVLPPAPVGSAAWLWQRIVWVVTLAALFVPIALALRPAERLLPARRGPAAGPLGAAARVLLAAGAALAGYALAAIAARGFAPGGRLPSGVLGAYAAGIVLLTAAGRARARSPGISR